MYVSFSALDWLTHTPTHTHTKTDQRTRPHVALKPAASGMLNNPMKCVCMCTQACACVCVFMYGKALWPFIQEEPLILHQTWERERQRGKWQGRKTKGKPISHGDIILPLNNFHLSLALSLSIPAFSFSFSLSHATLHSLSSSSESSPFFLSTKLSKTSIGVKV